MSTPWQGWTTYEEITCDFNKCGVIKGRIFASGSQWSRSKKRRKKKTIECIKILKTSALPQLLQGWEEAIMKIFIEALNDAQTSETERSERVREWRKGSSRLKFNRSSKLKCKNTHEDPARVTWCSLRLILTAGATTFCRRSRSTKTHSSLVAMRKSPLNRVLKPYRKDSRLREKGSDLLGGGGQRKFLLHFSWKQHRDRKVMSAGKSVWMIIAPSSGTSVKLQVDKSAAADRP